MVSYDVSALIEYKGLSVENAADEVIHKKLSGLGGTGGLIAIDSKGNFAMPFNTPGMYRGHLMKGQEPLVKIFKE